MLLPPTPTTQILPCGTANQSGVKAKKGLFARLFGGRSKEADEASSPTSPQAHDPWREGMTQAEMRRVRAEHMFSKLTLFYQDGSGGGGGGKDGEGDRALCLIRGEGQYVFDEAGKR